MPRVSRRPPVRTHVERTDELFDACWRGGVPDRVAALAEEMGPLFQPNAMSRRKHTTLLNVAIQSGCLATVQLLLRLGADPNLGVDDAGRCPLRARTMSARYDTMECYSDIRLFGLAGEECSTMEHDGVFDNGSFNPSVYNRVASSFAEVLPALNFAASTSALFKIA